MACCETMVKWLSMFFLPPGAPPYLRPPGFRKWSIIFMLRRHKPTLSAAVAFLYNSGTSQLKVSLCQLHNPHTSHFIHTFFSLITWICIHGLFVLPYTLSFHFLSRMTPAGRVGHVWEKVKCLVRCLNSGKMADCTSLNVDLTKHHKNKNKLRVKMCGR